MNWDRVEGNWKQFKGDIQKHWGKLTDDDIQASGGQRKKLEGKIQERYGITKDQASKKVDEFLNSMN